MPLTTIASHRRSGTHLAIDLLRNNVSSFADYYISLRELQLRTNDRAFMKLSAELLRSEQHIIKSHAIPSLREFYCESPRVAELCDEAVERSKTIYLARDVRDVMISLFHYTGREGFCSASLHDFIREANDYCAHMPSYRLSRIEYWAHHVAQWRSLAMSQPTRVMIVLYEDVLSEPRTELARIAEFLEEKPNRHFVDVRRTEQVTPQHASLTSVSFRSGRAGEWRSHFDIDCLTYVNRAVSRYRLTMAGLPSED